MQIIKGEIHNRDRAKQLRDFSGLLFGNITPTDIDGLIEYHSKGYILIETKLNDASLEFGQRLALERLTDDLSHKPTICIITRHDVGNPELDIDVANTIVTEYRYKNLWRLPREPITARELIERFVDWQLSD